MRAAGILGLAMLALAACKNTDKRLQDLSWGEEFEADYPAVVDRAVDKLYRKFPLGLDPDRSKREEGDLWTLWRYDMTVRYRGSIRVRARVKIEDLGDGKVRLGVAVLKQLNDNLDNPELKEDARWVGTARDANAESTLERSIAQRYSRLKPSKYWEEKHRTTKRKGLRGDIVDRNRDVDLEGAGKIDPDRTAPAITGVDAYNEDTNKKKDRTKKKKK